jgi:segregation and condensation protein B
MMMNFFKKTNTTEEDFSKVDNKNQDNELNQNEIEDINHDEKSDPIQPSLSSRIESILFWKGEPIKIKKLSEILEVEKSEIEKTLDELKETLKNRGVSLILNDEKVGLVTNPINSELIEKIKKEELTKDLSKATLETLSIILYQSPIKRSKIDYIRGVNSQFTLRILLVRGLIEKEVAKDDERTYVYKPSMELLSFMGISSLNELPEFESVKVDIDNFMTLTEETNKEKEFEDDIS